MTADTTTAPEHPQAITMTYRNYRGEIADRTFIPNRIWWGSTDWHPEPGWLISGLDMPRGVQRDFSLVDCQFADLCCAPVAQDGQPVAWMVEGYGLVDNRAFADLYSRKAGKRVEPLYTHPAPQPSDEAATLRAQLAEVEKRVEELGEELYDAETGPWPHWAESILKTLQEFGYRFDDLIDLPEEVDNYLREYPGSATNGLIEQRDDAIDRAEAAEAALTAAEDHAELQNQVLVGAAEFAHVLTLSCDNQIAAWAHTLEDVCRAALAAHQARRAGG